MSKGKKIKRERETKKQTLNYGEQTDGHQRGGRWGMGEIGAAIKEGTSCDEY